MDKEKFVNEIKWIYGGLSGVCLIFFLALSNTKISLVMFSWLSAASFWISIAFPLCVSMLMLAVEIEQKQVKDLKIKLLKNSNLFRFVFGFSASFVCLGIFCLVVHISGSLAIIMLVIGLVGFFIVQKMLGRLGIK